ncbi:MAG: hypothetical protein V1835_04945 [Candidatus Micrarchaeota archaeon]
MYKPALMACALLLLLAPQAMASCSFLQIASIPSLPVVQGTVASFPIAIKNNGIGSQNVYLSAMNKYSPLIDTYFDASVGTLSPSQDSVFTFFADTMNAQSGTYDFAIEISSDAGAGICTEKLNLTVDVTPSEEQPQNDAEQVSASISPDQLQQLVPSEVADYYISIKNGLDETIFASLDAPSNVFDSSTRFAESDFRISPKGIKVVKASITLPPGTPGGDYEVVFRVRTTSACCIQEFLLPVMIRSYSKNAVLDILNAPLSCLEVIHGMRKFISFGIRNRGEVEGPFNLELYGSDSALLPVSSQLKQFELGTGEHDYFNLTILPPESMPIDTYQFKLRLRYNSFILADQNICYKVTGISNLEVEKPEDTNVKRCAVGSLEFKVQNVGTLKDEYSIETKPMIKAVSYADPETFTLSPREKQLVNLVVQTSCITPLGKQIASLTIRPKNAAARTENFEINIVPSNLSGESFLKIDAPLVIRAVEGQEKKIFINVLNAKSEDMPSTVVSIEGIEKDWFAVESPKTIKTGKTAPYRAIFTPLAPGTYKLKIVAASGLEISKFNSELMVEGSSAKIDYTYDIEPVSENGVVKEAIVTLAIKNNGNIVAKGISVASPSQDLNLVQLDYIAELAPGESRDVRVQVQPLQDTVEKDIMLKVSSFDGAVSTAKAVTIPALKKINAAEELPWRYILIAILVLLIMWLFGKQTI